MGVSGGEGSGDLGRETAVSVTDKIELTFMTL